MFNLGVFFWDYSWKGAGDVNRIRRWGCCSNIPRVLAMLRYLKIAMYLTDNLSSTAKVVMFRL